MPEEYKSLIYTALAVLVAIVILIMIMRFLKTRTRGKRGKRLGISEFREIDQSRRLLLVRRDDVEHLVLIGGGQDLVIEQNITSGFADYDNQYSSPPAPAVEAETTYEEESRPPPRPAVFGDRAPNIRPVRREPPGLGPVERDY